MHIILSDNQYFMVNQATTCCSLSCSFCSSFATLSFWPFLPIDPRFFLVKPSAMAPGWSASATGQGHGLEEIPWEWRQRGPLQKCSCRPLDFLDCLSLGFVYGNDLTRKSTHFFVNSCALKFALCLSRAFLIYSTLSTESIRATRGFGQTVARLYMYVCLNMYMHITYMCHICIFFLNVCVYL